MSCRGEDPGPLPWEWGKGWLKAPHQMRTKPAVIEHLKSTGDELIAAAGDDMERLVWDEGEAAPVYQRLNFCFFHTWYHAAQLNFIQSMAGDVDFHL